MKKSMMALMCGAFFAVFAVNAFAQEANETTQDVENVQVPYHGTWLPDGSTGFKSDNIYFGAEGIFSLPVLFTGEEKIAGIGFGAAFEAGYDLAGWLLGTHMEFRTSLNNGNYMKSMNDLFITLEASKIIGHDLVSFLPSAIDFRPTVGIGVNVISANYYKNSHYKNNDVLTQKTSTTMVCNLGLNVEYTKLDKVIPYAGFDANFSGDKDGLFSFLGFNIGCRTTLGRLIPPKVFGLSIEPSAEMFTPDGDGKNDSIDIIVKASFDPNTKCEEWKLDICEIIGKRERVVKSFSGTGKPPKKIRWSGESDKDGFTIFSVSEFPVKMTIKDSEGKETSAKTTISTGLLVEKAADGTYKIRIPPISFDANAATFNTLTAEQKKANDFTIKTVAEGLKKFGKYKVLVQGHANNTTGTEEEEVNELIPLSKERAEVIMKQLIDLGIDASRLSAEGKGGREPIASGEDSSRNRRVEFILFN